MLRGELQRQTKIWFKRLPCGMPCASDAIHSVASVEESSVKKGIITFSQVKMTKLPEPVFLKERLSSFRIRTNFKLGYTSYQESLLPFLYWAMCSL